MTCSLIHFLELGITTLISMRGSQIRSKEHFGGVLKTTLTEVLQNNLDSALDISKITTESSPVLLNKFKVVILTTQNFFKILLLVLRSSA